MHFLLEFLKFKLPQTSFLPLFLKSLVITGFLGRLIPLGGFVNLLVIFENKACSDSISGTKVYASAYE